MKASKQLLKSQEASETSSPITKLMSSPDAKSNTKARGAAKPKRMAKKKKATKKATKKADVAMADRPTEELWTAYGKEFKKVGRDGSVKLQELRNELMERHMPLVRYHAERLQQTLPKSIELDDLISAGTFGLMDAIRGFDPDRGYKFKTYCSTRIRGAILDQLRSQDWVPRLVRVKATRIERMYQKLMGEYGREPSHSELARHLDLEHGELLKEMEGAKAKAMYSLSEKWDDGDDGDSVEKMDIVEDRTAEDPVNELNKRDLMLYMTKSLTHKEQFIIEQYYQLGHTMREIGEMLALTESRVCQIHSNVMGRLRGLLDRKQDNLMT
jgi:RNA polymerase sigma factor for flagellar operon FliA